MPHNIDRDELQRLLSSGAQLVEVMPADEYEERHLPGAISIPLGDINAESIQSLDLVRPVIVYCWDSA